MALEVEKEWERQLHVSEEVIASSIDVGAVSPYILTMEDILQHVFPGIEAHCIVVVILGWEFQFLVPISGTPNGSGIPILF